MLMTFTIFITAIFHVSDTLFKMFNRKHPEACARRGRAAAQPQPSSQVRNSQLHQQVSQSSFHFTVEEILKTFTLLLYFANSVCLGLLNIISVTCSPKRQPLS